MRFGGFVLLLSLVGCVSDPKFEQSNEAPTTASEPTISSGGDMVLVPATTLSRLSTQADKGKGKGKGGDDDDDKKPAPAPAPSPAPKPAPTSAPTPTPAPPVGSIVVPAFWIDMAAVTPGDYDFCVSFGACTPSSCRNDGAEATCITHVQASVYCAWKEKRLVRDDEWNAAVEQSPAGLKGLSGGVAEWVESGDEGMAIARGGATSSASTPLGLDSSIPTVGFRCARDR